MWFALSAEQDNGLAVDNRKAAADEMTPEQIAKAKDLAAQWKPKGEQ